MVSACFEHSNFFTVNDLGPRRPTAAPGLTPGRPTASATTPAKAPPRYVPTNSIAGTGTKKGGDGRAG